MGGGVDGHAVSEPKAKTVTCSFGEGHKALYDLGHLESSPDRPSKHSPVPAKRWGHQICSLATAGHRGAERLSDAVSQVAPVGRREDVVSRFDGESSLHNP